MLDTYEQNSKKKLVATVVAVVVIAGLVVLADVFKSKNSTDASTTQATTQSVATNSTDTTTTPTTTDTTSTDTSTSSSTSSGTYKDGTYSATSSYYVPHGDESIKVTATISGGTITDVSIVNSESDRDSQAYQEDFTSSYKSYVVGKKISGLTLTNIAGASDTTQGFNDALSQIASEAQA